jgi:putative ABC transport system permease protein
LTPIELTTADMALAALSLLIASGLSVALSLNVHRALFVAALRMIAQLVVVGLALRYVFALSSPVVTLLVAGLMILAAIWEVASRQRFHLRGWYHFGLGGLPVTIATVLVSALALSTALREAEWLDAQHTIPLVGIILGTVMNSTSLALNTMLTSVQRERRAIEARLSLGAGGKLALFPPLITG